MCGPTHRDTGQGRLLLADEDVSPALIRHLADLGHDVVCVRDPTVKPRRERWTDERVLDEAIARGRVVITHNRRDFIKLHQIQRDHPGVVVVSRAADLSQVASRIDRAMVEQGDLTGQLLRVNRPGPAEV